MKATKAPILSFTEVAAIEAHMSGEAEQSAGF
jgi:hypothetical protein